MSIFSPIKKKKEVIEVGFPEAMAQIIAGQKVTRAAWPASEYGLLKDGFLMLFRADGEFYKWTVTDGDLLATDWRIYNA